MTTRRRGGNIQKGLKDYLVPIIGGILILILIFSIFSGSDDQNINTDNENKIGLDLELLGENAESFIVYEGDYKDKIDSSTDLYKGEKLLVTQGYASIEFPSVASMNLDKNGELKYEVDGSLSLYSSDLWINSSSSVNVGMRYAKVNISSNSTVSLTQNEVSSTVYLLSGMAEVSNLSGKSSVLAPGEKITISRSDASNEELDLSLSREPIDEYFKGTNWFIRNNGDSYLSNNSNDEDIDETSSTGTTSSQSGRNTLISFDNLSDESLVTTSTINISGVYSNEEITTIELNGKEAVLNSNNKTFSFSSIDVSNKENDLVFKIYDDANDLLSKFVYTVYYNAGTASSGGGFTVKNYSVDGNDFTFTSPSTTGTYTTEDDSQVTIRGLVTDENVASVVVNGFTLSSYNGSTWRYHASPVNNNLKEGTNIYEVKYLSKDGVVIYTNNFTIIKQSGKTSSTYSVESQI